MTRTLSSSVMLWMAFPGVGQECIRSSMYLSFLRILAAFGLSSTLSLAIFNITKLAMSGKGLSPKVTLWRAYVAGCLVSLKFLQRNRWTWVSSFGRQICEYIFEISLMKVAGSSRKRSRTPSRFPMRHGPSCRKEFKYDSQWCTFPF